MLRLGIARTTMTCDVCGNKLQKGQKFVMGLGYDPRARKTTLDYRYCCDCMLDEYEQDCMLNEELFMSSL